MNNPLVSIVITTKNEERHIENCLKSIVAQSYPNIEIIVVDNNSIDKTKEIVSSFCHSSLSCHSREGGNPVCPPVSFFTYGPERSAQRNYGLMQKAKGEYAMFLDADMTLSPDLIKTCVDFIQQNNYAALHISEIVTGEKFWSRVRRFERSFYDGTVIDGARFFRQNIFVKVGGFDETMSGPEDWDLDKKLKQIGAIGLVPSGNNQAVIYHNEAEFNLKKYLSKKSYYAGSFVAYINKWGKNDQDIKKQLGFFYRYFGVFIEKRKWRRLLTHPILGAGMYLLRGMVGVMFLMKSKNNL
jgi:glycosyltransferase involved in cell wall biosynthesis